MKDIRSLILDVATAACAVAAVVTAVTFARDRGNANTSRPSEAPVAIDSATWKRLVVGHRFGGSGPRPPLTFVEFVDFECPSCRGTVRAMDGLLRKYPGAALIVHHFPLGQHRFAPLAAQASECAGSQDRFEQMYRTLFTYQDSIGLIPFQELAHRAGVADGQRFETCMRDKNIAAAIDSSRDAAVKLGIRGTPGFIINGVIYPTFPANSVLDSLARISAMK